METLERIVAAHPFFAGLEKPHLKLITGCASNVRFESGRFICHTGDKAENFYLIREGKVALELHAPGRGTISILTLEAGEILGWSWLVPPYRWKFDARTVEPTRALALDGKCLRKKAEADHDLGYELFKRFTQVMEERLDATRLQLMNVYEVHA
ncbi:MAG TPA: cyclic nucleotide-binding domain-containing protein [Terriglobia bacterium]|nr:cyclic nucleotide-binding domain-containing protein [Terriglobia bacterium]